METMQRVYTSNFLRGMARALDLRGAIKPLYLQPRTEPQYASNDAAANADWRVVYADLDEACRRVRQRHGA